MIEQQPRQGKRRQSRTIRERCSAAAMGRYCEGSHRGGQAVEPGSQAALEQVQAKTDGRGSGMGAMMGRMGAMMGGQRSAEAKNRQLRGINAASAAEFASRDTYPQSKAILKRLEEPISMSFAAETTLEDVWAHQASDRVAGF